MPRPKRTRAAATRQTQARTHRGTRDPSAAAGSSSDIYDVSDREKEKTRRRRLDLAADASSAGLESPPSQPQPQPGMGGSHQRANALGEPTEREREGGAPRVADTPDASDDADSPPEVGRRSRSGPRLGRPTDVSGLDLDDDMFGDLDDSLISEDDAGSVQQPNDTSNFNVAASRKRNRASSIVGRDDAPIRPSSRGPNTPGISSTFSFGHFRRRQREPSILGTGPRHRSRSRQPQASGGESADEGDFSLNLDPTQLGSPSRQPDEDGARDGSREGAPGGRPRKRKSLEDHGSSGNKRVTLGSDDVCASVESDDASISPARGRSPPRARTSDPDDPDLAPPMSSDSSDDGGAAVWPPLGSLAHRAYRVRRPASRAQKTPEPCDSGSDIPSPPSLTHSPNDRPPPRAAKNTRPPQKNQKKVTTANLASLLPRRRHRGAGSDATDGSEGEGDDDDDAAGADSGEDDDELSYGGHKRAARARNPPRRLGSRNNGGARNAKQAAAAGKAVRWTYGVRRGSDKDNLGEDESAVGAEPGDEDGVGGEAGGALPDETSSQTTLAGVGEELKKAARKFKEVDKWELEFEEATQSSSPG